MPRPWLSVLMAYRDRGALLARTLASWRHWYGDACEGIELVLVDDTSASPLSALRAVVALVPWACPPKLVRVDRTGAHNPGVLYNQAAALATAPLLALTNPENLHLGPVFTHARDVWQPGHYLVYGCRSLTPAAASRSLAELIADPEPVTECWLQHSHHLNRGLHFSSMMGASDYARTGFDPAYDEGHGYDDNDFFERVVGAGLQVQVIDEPAVGHQAHARGWTTDATQANAAVFRARWGRDPWRT